MLLLLGTLFTCYFTLFCWFTLWAIFETVSHYTASVVSCQLYWQLLTFLSSVLSSLSLEWTTELVKHLPVAASQCSKRSDRSMKSLYRPKFRTGNILPSSTLIEQGKSEKQDAFKSRGREVIDFYLLLSFHSLIIKSIETQRNRAVPTFAIHCNFSWLFQKYHFVASLAHRAFLNKVG